MSRSKRRRRRTSDKIRIPKQVAPLIVVGAGLLLMGAAALFPWAGNNGNMAGSPRLVVEQEVFDYGEVAFNTPVETVFVLRNEGNAPLRILGTPQVELRDGC